MLAGRFSAALLAFVAAGRLVAADAPDPIAKPPQATLQKLVVFPEKIELKGPRGEQRVGVLGIYADGRQWELTRTAKYTSADPKIATVDVHGLALGLTNGQTTFTVEASGQKVTVPLTVTGANPDAPIDFSREIVPIFTRTGCNMGACHGSQHGRGGFKLSLLGYEAEFDHPQIVQSAEGRRIVQADPERSILLLKPTLALEHGGGERFKHGSREYNLIKRWLEDGAPAPTRNDATVTALEVWPTTRVMVPGEQQQIHVRATWSDGLTTDVTPIAQFNALSEGVATVNLGGLITANSTGETHVMIRFLGQATVMQVTLPYTQLAKPIDFPANNFIDDKLKAKWQQLGLTPSGLCSDEDFFRRIHLDGIGTVPSPVDVKAFLAGKSADKRKKAIDRVLDRPEFVDYWALKWGDLLRINREQIQDKGMWSFHNWVRASLRDGKSLDVMARDIITAEGSTFTDGPANYYQLSTGADNQAETTAQVFLGVRMQCAKCHHHPFEKWSQDDYYGMSAFFVRLGTKSSQEFGLFGRETVIFLRPTGEQGHPKKGGVVKPHPLDGPVMDDPFDRRRKLGEWLVDPKNPFFARNFANRYWAYLMGRGLVEPVDDVRATNPATNPELLDALAKHLAESKYDVKSLLRAIMNSRAYQLSSKADKGNQADATNAFYARYTKKRVTAEQVADAIDFATETKEKYPGLPPGTRAIQLPDTTVRSFLLDVFGRPARRITCECERTMQPNIAQALHLLNGTFLNQKIVNPAGRVERLVKANTPLPAAIEEMYLVTLSRPPRADEVEWAKKWVGKAATVREGLQDLLWVLINAREFQIVN